jgi:hypothetical protein
MTAHTVNTANMRMTRELVIALLPTLIPYGFDDGEDAPYRVWYHHARDEPYLKANPQPVTKEAQNV